MATPNAGFAQRESGAGADTTLPTHTPSGLTAEFPVTMLAQPSGHILGSAPTYYFFAPEAAPIATANSVFLDIFNASGSGVTLYLRKLFLIPGMTTAVATGVAFRFELFRSSAVGTSGTTLTAVKAATANAALPAQVTARSKATGGATNSGGVLNYVNSHGEETTLHNQLQQYFNVMMDASELQPLTLVAGEGMVLRNVQASALGNFAVLAAFTVE